jgi:hypothetical protein
MVVLLERLPGHMILLKDWKKILKPDPGVLILLLALAPVYAIFIDSRSTFKIIMIAYIVFGVFLLGKFNLRNKGNMVTLIVLAICLAAVGGVYALVFAHSNLSFIPRVHIDNMSFFFPNPAQQWYFNRPTLIPAVAFLAAMVICIRTIHSNPIPSFLAALLIASALFFTIFFGYLSLPRYLTIMQLWFVVVIAIGLFGLFAFLLVLPRNEIILPLMTTTVFALTFNISQTMLPTFYDKQGNMPITKNYHYDLGPTEDFLRDKVNDHDVLLSTIYEGWVRWRGFPKFGKIVSYSFVEYTVQYKWIFPYEVTTDLPTKPRELIGTTVEENDSGWIVLDSITYFSTVTRPLPLKNTILDNKEIEYLGYHGGEYIWKWHVIQP